MEITEVGDVLQEAGFRLPLLAALHSSVDNYSVLVLQPGGEVSASPEGVCHHDPELASKQFGAFLADANGLGSNLAISPEYSMPWGTLVEALRKGAGPAEGDLWVLGCESITYASLEALRLDLADQARMLFEPLEPANGRFLDPLAYVFVAKPLEGEDEPHTIVLVQFKTSPMSDQGHFEVNRLQVGSRVYRFRNQGDVLSLVSLICSDALVFEDAHAQQIHDRALVIHLQLNKSPSHFSFRQSREKLLGWAGDATEVLCVNWARDVCLVSDGHVEPWETAARSAWYVKSTDFDLQDQRLCASQRRGLYYTWRDELKTHALFFNFDPALYELLASKVAHVGLPGPLSRRVGPKLERTSHWDLAAETWVEVQEAAHGFTAEASESDGAQAELRRLVKVNALAAERVMTLCGGRVGHSEEWYSVQELDACSLDAQEVIRRVTFCQDTREHAKEFRTSALRRCGGLWAILADAQELPPALGDFTAGFSFEWSFQHPHENAVSVRDRLATVVYMGEEVTDADVTAAHKKLADLLGRSYADVEQTRSAKQRLVIWYRRNGVLMRHDDYAHVRIDRTDDVSEYDIGREG